MFYQQKTELENEIKKLNQPVKNYVKTGFVCSLQLNSINLCLFSSSYLP